MVDTASRGLTATPGKRGSHRPDRLEWLCIAAILAALALATPEILRRTIVSGTSDVQVFFRAAWAVWRDYPLYQVVDLHGWHYHYPPSLAFLMAPFADPLPGYAHPAWSLPYPVGVAVWYALSVIIAFAAVHFWASALARAPGAPVAHDERLVFWTLRLFPVIAMMPYIGSGWARGQPTALLVLLMVLYLSLALARRPFLAGLALSAAIAFKMFPAILLLIPILRRDFRSLAWILLGCILFLFVLPAACVGIDQTLALYRQLWTDRLSGFASGQLSETIRNEISPWPDSIVSIGPILARIFSAPSPDAPYLLPVWARAAQLAADAAIVGAVAVVGHGRFWRLRGPQPAPGFALLVAGALLMAIVPAMLPTSKAHYWSMAAPLVAVLAFETLRKPRGSAGGWWLVAWAVFAWVAFIAVDSNELRWAQPYGLTAVAMIVLFIAGLFVLRRAEA